MDRLTKVTHFIPVKTTYKVSQLADLYMAWIVSLHGVPKKIILDTGSQFTSRFWISLLEDMDTKLNFSLAYHPQTNGQTKRTNQVLEGMLRACALQHSSSWDKGLPYAEFSGQSEDVTIRSFICQEVQDSSILDQTREKQIFGPELIQEAE
jgi:transposase InsO family protein